jgi:di/tricarboxylate transporter
VTVLIGAMIPVGAVIESTGAAATIANRLSAVGASLAFRTPVGHRNNLLVMGLGRYRFGDYCHLGLPLEILIVAIVVSLIPVF